ncbi:hypothetical protein SODALDRAFT_295431 [Sodiomyces alkalinus F11]|uniref:DUF676 domain-containing protein n=1 Tax=Sodiomyces alkalinus (strain CBS 110278 / VKM F-3762 / F11) TaxID=1314773 RepID=A0A3N2PVQ6_SODAK|nr:hypothetical protein SODALDRAFT_295431 [Sodiomyces alkalinus F11]ROT38590.1 hypothetical protein SODALDRAFT_295431 [Sodiomyces alkalinus F11]
MSRTLLLCFIHGFKGTDDTFKDFPYELKRDVARQLLDHRVESVVYPKYETKGELAEATAKFLEWLKEKVMDIRKANLENPWPPNDRQVGVILVAHSMGGFVAADALFLALDQRAENESEDKPLFPLIQGILAFDTAYNGLARSMFVYGAFSNYQKVSSVFNVMTALGAAAPAGLSSLAAQRAASAATAAASLASSSSSPGPASGPASASSSSRRNWKLWQLVAVQTGTIGAIAAGGVVAYMNREAIIRGVKSVRNLNRESVVEGYRQGMETLGQGLAYINRGNVGRSFAWLSDHFTFVGTLMKQKELGRRLDRMAALRGGVGIRDFYISLGENGYWSGGYFVPERTFCAVPDAGQPASALFTRCAMRGSADELQAHLSMFRPDKNTGYEKMKDEAAELVVKWFSAEEEIVDDPNFRQVSPEETEEDAAVEKTLSNTVDERGPEAGTGAQGATEVKAAETGEDDLPDESPVDIAAAASLVPLPEDGHGELTTDTSAAGPESGEPTTANERKRTYMQYLFGVAQQAGQGAKDWWPNKVHVPIMSMPSMPSMPSKVSMPSMPKMPTSVSALGNASMPSVNIFKKREAEAEGTAATATPGADSSGQEGNQREGARQGADDDQAGATEKSISAE